MADSKSSSPLSERQLTPASAGADHAAEKVRRRSKKANSSNPAALVTLAKQPWTVSQLRLAEVIILSNNVVRQEKDLPLLPSDYPVKHSEVGNESTFPRMLADLKKIEQRRQQRNSPPRLDSGNHASRLREVMAQIHKDLLDGATVEPGVHVAWIETELVMGPHSVVHLSTKLFVR